ncbi:Uncharacterized protein FWK35_00039276, partial [Aphis craccivora]
FTPPSGIVRRDRGCGSFFLLYHVVVVCQPKTLIFLIVVLLSIVLCTVGRRSYNYYHTFASIADPFFYLYYYCVCGSDSWTSPAAG